MKKVAMSAPLLKAFAIHESMRNTAAAPSTLMYVHYRPQETIWISPQQDRVTVIFSTIFDEETDRVLGKVFLQEFADARRQLSLQNAPQVLHSKDAPGEIRHLPEIAALEDKDTGHHYVTFVLFPRHFAPGPPREIVLAQIPLFRDYLHYHVKCCKAYMHSRMRKRVAGFLKVLNRAKPENLEQEKKLASGRAFRQSIAPPPRA